MINFDLFIQSTYSLNGSIIDIDKVVNIASFKGYKTLALVDDTHLYGAIKFYKKCLALGIKPIIGLESIIKSDIFGDIDVLIMSKSNKGYKNLIQISSYMSTNSETYFEDIKNFFEDITLIIKSDKGILSNYIYEDNIDKVNKIISFLNEYSKEVYIGLDTNDYQFETKVAQKVEKLGNAIIINKVKYYEKEDIKTSNVLSKILKEEKENEGLFTVQDVFYNLKDLSELDKMYSFYRKALLNSINFIDSCDLKIDLLSRHLPKYPVKEDTTALEKLKNLSNRGLIKRLGQAGKQSEYQNYLKRLVYELKIIQEMGYEDYFLIVWDFVLYAKKKNILVGPGRGSAAGSLVAYVLGIVDVDPIENDLYFERFLNPERISMPDIDIDFPDNKREEVIQYVINKYGKEKVVSIVTFGTFQGKSAVRDVGRILGIDTIVLDDISKNLSKSNNSLEEFRKLFPKEYSYYSNIDYIKELIEIATKLTGLVKHVSTHAAGIIISREDIRNFSPIQNGLLNSYQTQFEASDLEDIGLLKFDFLGLGNLRIISDTINLIKDKTNKTVNIYKVPLDDNKTYQLLKQVDVLGVFQLESKGMMDLARSMQISTFLDIATVLALYRPGPMENIPTFLRRRNKEERITYPHKDLLPILKKTNGIIIYQEQIMEIANKFAGYSLGEADVLRRAVSKKKKAVLENERKKFVKGSINQGYLEETANIIYDYIVKFANYGFNKSHAVAYGLVAYWMAYLKANYGEYFMSVLLNSQIGSTRGTKRYIMECHKMGLNIFSPSINKSNIYYSPEGKNLRFPYNGIKGLGIKAAQSIVNLQNEKPVSSLMDFVTRRTGIHINVIESMIFAGCFDDFGMNKRTMIENLPNIINFVDFNYQNAKFKYVEYDEYDYLILHEKEKEVLGLNFQYNIIYKYNDYIKKNKISYIFDIVDNNISWVSFIGIISNIKVIKTKKNDEMAFIGIEDGFSNVEGIIFPKKYLKYKDLIKKGEVYIFNGRKDIRNNRLQINIETINNI